MAICPVDERGYCTRHKVVHRGAWLRWALDPSERGEAYRRKWDERPTDQEIDLPVIAPPRSARLGRRHLPCVHLGAPTGEQAPCGHCGRPDQQVAVYGCAQHGRCTVEHRAALGGQHLAWCQTCHDYRAAQAVALRPGTYALSFRPPGRPSAAHGLGDAVHFAHLLALYRRRGIEIAVEGLRDHLPVFRLAGAEMASAGLPVPWIEPPKTFDAKRLDWELNKNGINLNHPPLPALGDPHQLWTEYCAVRLDGGQLVGAAEREWLAALVGRRPRPWIVLHTQGYGWGSFRNYSQADALRLQSLLAAEGATVFVLDREQSAPRADHSSVIAVRHFGVEQLAALLEAADLFLGIDSGPLHFLRLTHTPGVGLWDVHYPGTYALPRDQTLHLVTARHWERDLHQRWRWNTLLNPANAAEFVLEQVRRLLAGPRYLPDGPVARDVQLQGWVDWLCSPWRDPRWPVAVDRHLSFDLVLRRLACRQRPVILETGTIRQAEDWAGAGYSTYLWGAYAAARQGTVHSIDVDAGHVEFARAWTRDFGCVEVHHADSVEWLRQYDGPPVDVLYLDSLDTDQPGHAEHCLAEVQAILPRLAAGALVLIDDTPRWRDDWQGKGRLAVPWLIRRGWQVLHSGWQVVLSRVNAGSAAESSPPKQQKSKSPGPSNPD